jgi:hypothetical protein
MNSDCTKTAVVALKPQVLPLRRTQSFTDSSISFRGRLFAFCFSGTMVEKIFKVGVQEMAGMGANS